MVLLEIYFTFLDFFNKLDHNLGDIFEDNVTNDFIERLGKLNLDLGLKAGLQHVGISKSDVSKLSEDAMKQTRLLVNNPRELNYDDAVQIYSASL